MGTTNFFPELVGLLPSWTLRAKSLFGAVLNEDGYELAYRAVGQSCVLVEDGPLDVWSRYLGEPLRETIDYL